MKFVKNDECFKKFIIGKFTIDEMYKSYFQMGKFKKNKGFIIMDILIIIFTMSFVLYYISAGFLKIQNYMNEAIEDKNLIDIIKNKGTTNGGGKKNHQLKLYLNHLNLLDQK